MEHSTSLRRTIAIPPAKLLSTMLAVCGAAVIVTGVGCSRSGLATAEVHGTATLDGVPLTRGTVMFVPEMGRAGRGIIQPDGTFRVSCYADGDGAVVGLNRVSVVVPFGEDASPEEIKRHRIPRKYSAPSTSGLTLQVEPDRVNEVHLELTSKP